MDARAIGSQFHWTRILAITSLLNGMSMAATLPIERQFAAPGSGSEGMAFVGSDLWVWGADQPDAFYVVNPTTGAVKASYLTPATGGRTGLAYDGSSVWGVSADAEYPPFMAKFNPTDGAVISYYDVPVRSPTGIEFDGQHLWVCGNGDSDTRVVSLDPNTMQAMGGFSLSLQSPGDLAWDGVNLWMGGGEWLGPGAGWREFILQLDPVTGAIRGTFDAPGQAVVGLAWDRGLLYVSDPALDTVYVLRTPEPSTGLAFLALGFLLTRLRPRVRFI